MERKGQRKKGSGARERGSQIDGTERKEMKKRGGGGTQLSPSTFRSLSLSKAPGHSRKEKQREKEREAFALLPSSLSEHPLLRRMKGYYKVTARRASMEPAAAAGGGSGKKASGSGGGNSRGDDNAAASSSSLPGRPALADLINGTGVFAQESSEQQLLEQQDEPPTKKQRTLWPTPGGGAAAAAAGGLQVRSGRIAALERERERENPKRFLEARVAFLCSFLALINI